MTDETKLIMLTQILAAIAPTVVAFGAWISAKAAHKAFNSQFSEFIARARQQGVATGRDQVKEEQQRSSVSTSGEPTLRALLEDLRDEINKLRHRLFMEQLSTFEQIVNSLLKSSPPVLLALGLNALGFALRSIKRFDSDWLPLIMIICGGVAWPFLQETGRVSYDVSVPQVQQVVAGLVIGACAVGLHQAGRKLLGRFFDGKDKDETKTDT